MIQVVLRLNGDSDKIVMMPQVPQRGERLAYDDNLRETIIYRVESVTWIVPPQNAACKAIVEISY